MSAMNLRTGEPVSYGRAFWPVGPVSAKAARGVGRRSRLSFGIIERTSPRRRRRIIRLLIGSPR